MPKFSSTYQPKRKRSSIKNIDYSKMRADKIQRLTEEQYNPLTQKEMLELTKRAYTLAEKRVFEIGKKNYVSVALERYFGGELPSNPTSNMSRQQLMRKFASMQQFLRAQTSTAKGIEKHEKAVAERVFGEGTTKRLNHDESVRFWAAYHEFMEMKPIYQDESERIQKMIARMSFWRYRDFNAEDIMTMITEMEGKTSDKIVNRQYLKSKEYRDREIRQYGDDAKNYFSSLDLDDYDW